MLNRGNRGCRCGEMADAQDLKSWDRKKSCGFKSRHRHHCSTQLASRSAPVATIGQRIQCQKIETCIHVQVERPFVRCQAINLGLGFGQQSLREVLKAQIVAIERRGRRSRRSSGINRAKRLKIVSVPGNDTDPGTRHAPKPAQVLSGHLRQVDRKHQQVGCAHAIQRRHQPAQRTARGRRILHHFNVRRTPGGPAARRYPERLRLQFLQNTKLSGPKRFSPDLKGRLVHAHPARKSASEKHRREGHITPTRSLPPVRMTARKPPRPFRNCSAPGAKAPFIQWHGRHSSPPRKRNP